MQHYYALILAGGDGSRLWPLSRNSTPKQLLPLVEDVSMFRMSVDRLAPLFPPENILVVTGRRYINALRQEAMEIPTRNFIVEPRPCDTGPAAALGITVIHQRDPDAVVAVLTADHHISETAAFHDILEITYGVVCEQDVIVTLGVSDPSPSTALGYIKHGSHVITKGNIAFFSAREFTEKANFPPAAKFLRTGNYSWNSGVLIWSAQRALREFERQQPLIHSLLRHLSLTVDTLIFEDMLDAVWHEMPKVSLNCAVMENADRMLVAPISIGWSGVSNWDALYKLIPHDGDGNCLRGSLRDHILIDTQNSFIYSERLVATIGVDNIVVIDSGNALLICHKDRTEEVKQVVNELRLSERHKYL